MTGMLRKKELVTIVTPIPGFIPRQLAIDILHSHSEVITLNPLVLEHKAIKAPRDAASDEYYSTWYEITERIQYVPGLGRMGSGKISFNACFHNMPWGLQAHIYAPMSIDMRYKYQIGGNQPGVEPPEPLEMGLLSLGAPSDGLYLREDVEVKASIAVMSFVKSQLKAASKLMVQRIIKKAELVDAGVLHAMIENGKLKTINPADRSNTATGSPASSPSPALGATLDKNKRLSQQRQSQQPQQGSPPTQSETPGSPPPVPYQVPRPQSMQYPYGYRPGSAGIAQNQNQNPASPGLGVYGGYPGYQNYPMHPGQPSYYAGTPGGPGQGFYPHPQYPQQMHPSMYGQYPQMPPQFQYAELQAPVPSTAQNAAQGPGPVEMAGDFYHPQAPQYRQQQQHLAPAQAGSGPSSTNSTPQTNRDSETLSSGDWSLPPQSQYKSSGHAGSRPASTSSDTSGSIGGTGAVPPGGFRSPGLDKNFSSDLSTHRETPEEHRLETLKKLDSTVPNSVASTKHGQQPPGQEQFYNPAENAQQVQGR